MFSTLLGLTVLSCVLVAFGRGLKETWEEPGWTLWRKIKFSLVLTALVAPVVVLVWYGVQELYDYFAQKI